ncbi:hypothetical protein QMO14_23165 [Variovorax sp. CAN2819]|uniref:hypothetical protein n=1 Tax=Variovorax sp. CAN15 TaxID=3046727 RepID=UPI0026489693|nr:hypothetical protein [Variovorax sp. CAN15]MDN6886496.1 hypothetical protein [Variovorax sp. CAN15]
MSATQISFASFAAAQLAPATTPSQAQLELVTPPTFGGAFTPCRHPYAHECAGDVTGDFFMDWQMAGNLDAPDNLPRGSHIAWKSYDKSILADGFTFRQEY